MNGVRRISTQGCVKRKRRRGDASFQRTSRDACEVILCEMLGWLFCGIFPLLPALVVCSCSSVEPAEYNAWILKSRVALAVVQSSVSVIASAVPVKGLFPLRCGLASSNSSFECHFSTIRICAPHHNRQSPLALGQLHQLRCVP
jgi:hypothetical protein